MHSKIEGDLIFFAMWHGFGFFCLWMFFKLCSLGKQTDWQKKNEKKVMYIFLGIWDFVFVMYMVDKLFAK